MFAMVGAAIAAIAVVLLTTPVVRDFAIRKGAVDMPNERRINKVPVPSTGGVAIFLGFWMAVLVFGEFNNYLFWLFISSAIIMVCGFIDDFRNLSPKIKLVVQFGAAILFMVATGTRIHFIKLPLSNYYIGLGSFSYPLTLLWIVGITNALNFIDGLDGLAAGTAGIASTTLFLVALSQNNLSLATVLVALAGASFAFLRFNSHPAEIFMGDSGALSLGFLLATISAGGLMKSATAIAITVPVLILGLPIFDGTFSVLRRLARGQSPFVADRGHLHHRLLDRGLDQKLAVNVLYATSLCGSILALILQQGWTIVTGVLTLGTAVFISFIWREWRKQCS